MAVAQVGGLRVCYSDSGDGPPVLLIQGAGTVAEALIRGARYVEIPDAGHGVTIQLPEVVNEPLVRHLLSAAPQTVRRQ